MLEFLELDFEFECMEAAIREGERDVVDGFFILNPVLKKFLFRLQHFTPSYLCNFVIFVVKIT